jgi:hypothetical protein
LVAARAVVMAEAAAFKANFLQSKKQPFKLGFNRLSNRVRLSKSSVAEQLLPQTTLLCLASHSLHLGHAIAMQSLKASTFQFCTQRQRVRNGLDQSQRQEHSQFFLAVQADLPRALQLLNLNKQLKSTGHHSR